MHFVYGFCDGTSIIALMEYQHWYLDGRQPYKCVFEMVHHNLRETGTLMRHAHIGCWRHVGRGGYVRYSRFLLKQDFLRVQYGIICIRISCMHEGESLCDRSLELRWSNYSHWCGWCRHLEST
jgi:hypothetical protein